MVLEHIVAVAAGTRRIRRVELEVSESSKKRGLALSL